MILMLQFVVGLTQTQQHQQQLKWWQFFWQRCVWISALFQNFKFNNFVVLQTGSRITAESSPIISSPLHTPRSGQVTTRRRKSFFHKKEEENEDR